MGELPDIFILTNTFGALLGLSAMAIVATAVRRLIGAVRRGMIAMLWGLVLIVASFLSVFFGFGEDVQMVLLSLGMVMILIFSHQLFSLYNPNRV